MLGVEAEEFVVVSVSDAGGCGYTPFFYPFLNIIKRTIPIMR